MVLEADPDVNTRPALGRVVGRQGARLRVVVADDHPVMRAQLRRLLDAELDLEVVGTAWSGMEALRLVHQLEPDVLVSDQDMDDVCGREVAALLGVAGIGIRVVLYTTNDAEEDTSANAADYVLEHESIEALMKAIRRRPTTHARDSGALPRSGEPGASPSALDLCESPSRA
jgi:DNA-binding LytR/AlgR family response regulator